jgi:hypothetical protein
MRSVAPTSSKALGSVGSRRTVAPAAAGDAGTHRVEGRLQVRNQLVAALVALVAILRDHPVDGGAGLLVHPVVRVAMSGGSS